MQATLTCFVIFALALGVYSDEDYVTVLKKIYDRNGQKGKPNSYILFDGRASLKLAKQDIGCKYRGEYMHPAGIEVEAPNKSSFPRINIADSLDSVTVERDDAVGDSYITVTPYCLIY